MAEERSTDQGMRQCDGGVSGELTVPGKPSFKEVKREIQVVPVFAP